MLSYHSFVICTSDVEFINKTSAEVCVLQTSEVSMLFPAPKERINLGNTNCLSSTSCNQQSLPTPPRDNIVTNYQNKILVCLKLYKTG